MIRYSSLLLTLLLCLWNEANAGSLWINSETGHDNLTCSSVNDACKTIERALEVAQPNGKMRWDENVRSEMRSYYHKEKVQIYSHISSRWYICKWDVFSSDYSHCQHCWHHSEEWSPNNPLFRQVWSFQLAVCIRHQGCWHHSRNGTLLTFVLILLSIFVLLLSSCRLLIFWYYMFSFCSLFWGLILLIFYSVSVLSLHLCCRQYACVFWFASVCCRSASVCCWSALLSPSFSIIDGYFWMSWLCHWIRSHIWLDSE